MSKSVSTQTDSDDNTSIVYYTPTLLTSSFEKVNNTFVPTTSVLYNDYDRGVVYATDSATTRIQPPYMRPGPYGFIYPSPNILSYPDLNKNPKIQKNMVKYIYYKLLDKWLYDDSSDILNYLTVNSNNKVVTIKSLNDYKSSNIDNDSDSVTDQKIKFIEKYVISKQDIFNILSKFIKETSINWYDIPKQEYFIRQVIEKKIIKKFKRSIKSN
jgi:hypothetical protein